MKQLLIMLFLSFSSFAQDCAILKNGNYEMRYDSETPNSHYFTISGNHYYTIEENVEKEYEIIILGNCSFEIRNAEKVDESKFTDLQKILGKQQHYFEITKLENNIYFFICRVNLHIQCGTGKFIRKDF